LAGSVNRRSAIHYASLHPLYLPPDTLALMAKRDTLGRGPRYKAARNKVTAMVRRDKEMSNLAKLAEAGNLPTVLWEISNVAVAKPRQPLPASVKKADGTDTEGNLEAANVVNTYYVEKVRKIPAQEKIPPTLALLTQAESLKSMPD
jgi:hypothetical protein